MEETNVFIAFEIIQKSNPNSLYKELDLLILAGKKIHVWSKIVSPKQMKEFCDKIIVKPEDYNKEAHVKAWTMRHKEAKSYQEIAEALKIKVRLVSFYIKTDPTRSWKLSDWIIGYHVKDSSVYEKVDYLVDSDRALVDRFLRAGRKANYVEKV